MATNTAVTPTGANVQQTPQGPSFTIASAFSSALAFSIPATTLGTSPVNPNGVPLGIPPLGYISNIVLKFEVTYTAGSAAPTYTADAWDGLISGISVLSPNGGPIIPSVDGYALHMLNVFSGKRFGYIATPVGFDPDNLPNVYTTLPAADGAGKIVFYRALQFEIDAASGMGSLSAMAGNELYRINLSYNPLSSVFASNAPASASVTCEAVAYFWAAPVTGQTPYGSSQAIQTVDIVASQFAQSISAGANQSTLTAVGGALASHVLIFRNASGARDDADFPDVSQFVVNNLPRLYLTQDAWQNMMASAFNLYGPKDTATGLKTGVYVLPWRLLAGGASAFGQSNAQVLLTGTASTLLLTGTYGADGGLQVLSDTWSTPNPDFIYNH